MMSPTEADTHKKIVAFPWVRVVSYQYWAGRVNGLCVYSMTGTPEGSTESGYMQ